MCVLRLCPFIIFFFSWKVWLFNQFSATCGSHALFTNPQILLFSNFFIKNESHDTIYTFKNYFAIMFSVFSFQFQQNKFYPNRPLELLSKVITFFFFKNNKYSRRVNSLKNCIFHKGFNALQKTQPYCETYKSLNSEKIYTRVCIVIIPYTDNDQPHSSITLVSGFV